MDICNKRWGLFHPYRCSHHSPSFPFLSSDKHGPLHLPPVWLSLMRVLQGLGLMRGSLLSFFFDPMEKLKSRFSVGPATMFLGCLTQALIRLDLHQQMTFLKANAFEVPGIGCWQLGVCGSTGAEYCPTSACPTVGSELPSPSLASHSAAGLALGTVHGTCLAAVQ